MNTDESVEPVIRGESLYTEFINEDDQDKNAFLVAVDNCLSKAFSKISFLNFFFGNNKLSIGNLPDKFQDILSERGIDKDSKLRFSQVRGMLNLRNIVDGATFAWMR